MAKQLNVDVALRDIHHVFWNQVVARVGCQCVAQCNVVFNAARNLGKQRMRQIILSVFLEAIQGKIKRLHIAHVVDDPVKGEVQAK